MQVFRNTSVREMLLRDEASEAYLQRKHVHVASTGFALAASKCHECDDEDTRGGSAIYEKMAEGRDEGGEA